LKDQPHLFKKLLRTLLRIYEKISNPKNVERSPKSSQKFVVDLSTFL
jgi:uncharacterized protein (UPF0147 family)